MLGYPRSCATDLATLAGGMQPIPTDPLAQRVLLNGLKGVGPVTVRRLREAFGGELSVALGAPAEQLANVEGISRPVAAAIAARAFDWAAEMGRARDLGFRLLSENHEAWPAPLARLWDPPLVLYAEGGNFPTERAVGIIGSRHCTTYGASLARSFARDLAQQGWWIVSGLARGIDAAAHRGALDAGGRTLAVLGNGVLNVYPPEHADLAVEVIARGALLGEAPPLAPPLPGCFPRRNRIVSGLALGVVVVEAAERSGALITARLAGEQGREVFAVPGPVDARLSRGCHALIREGARLVQGIDDILDELGPLCEAAQTADGRTVRAPVELRLDDVERRVLDACDAVAGGAAAAACIDDVVAASGLAASQVLATLGVLEMRRILRRLPGNRVERTS